MVVTSLIFCTVRSSL